MLHLIDAITQETKAYYPKVKSSMEEIDRFRNDVLIRWRVSLDESYLAFLLSFDGVSINSLNFYGTKQQDDVYIRSAIDVNNTWSGIIPELVNYFIIGDSDMDFYCFDKRDATYHVIGKIDPIDWRSFSSFSEFLEYAIYRGVRWS